MDFVRANDGLLPKNDAFYAKIDELQENSTLWQTYNRLVYLDIDVLPVDEAAVNAMFDCAGAMSR